MDHSADQHKLALVAELDRSRAAISRDYHGVRYELDFSRKVKESIRANTLTWVGGAVAVGLVVTSLLRSRPASKPKRKSGKDAAYQPPVMAGKYSWIWPVSRTLLGLFKPVLIALATKIVARQVKQ